MITITSFVMPEGFLCEINLDEEVWLELGLHISRNKRKGEIGHFLAVFGKQGINSACCTQFLQLQHHFSKTRHPSGQMIPISTCYRLPPVGVPSKFPESGHCTNKHILVVTSDIAETPKL